MSIEDRLEKLEREVSRNTSKLNECYNLIWSIANKQGVTLGKKVL